MSLSEQFLSIFVARPTAYLGSLQAVPYTENVSATVGVANEA